MWMPERVWEQSYTRDLVAAGMEYTVLDDYHFKNAGLTERQLYGYYLTEDDGRVMSVLPGSERLRYTIPFADPHETISFLGRIKEEHPDPILVFGDDGEKFGTWPETHKHVYQDGWLERFFSALCDNQEWIRVTTLSEAVDNVQSLGKIYLPDCSYREMTEWALPTEQQLEYERVSHEMAHDPRWPAVRQFLRGGFWRNFRVKYPEADEMYCRMMAVSVRLADAFGNASDDASGDDVSQEFLDQAQTELYRGAVQLQLLARGVRWNLPAAPAQRRLQPLDCCRPVHRPGGSPPRSVDRSHGRRTTIWTAARRCNWPTTSSWP